MTRSVEGRDPVQHQGYAESEKQGGGDLRAALCTLPEARPPPQICLITDHRPQPLGRTQAEG